MSIVNYKEQSLTKQVGKRSLQAGVVGAGIMTAAAILPFLGVFAVILLLLLGGSAAYFLG